MVRQGVISGVVALAAGVGLAVAPVSASASTQRSTVAGSVAPVATSSAGTGAVAGSRSQTIQVWLAGDQSAAQAFVDGVSTPDSRSFHEYLSPAAYTQRFGASAQSAAAVRSWLSSEGMSDVAVSPQRDYVSATASTATMDRAFQTQLRSYSVTGPGGGHTTIQSNDSALSLPAALAPDVLSVTGLNSTPPNPQTDAAPTGSATTPCSHYWGQHTATLNPALDGLTSAGTPVCGYSADQIRAAYGQTMANDGAGVTIALIESGTPTAMGRTLADYARVNHLPALAPGQFREQVLGKNGTCGNFGDGEEQLDSESAYAMAPGADQLMVDGNPCQSGGEQNVFDAELAPLIGSGGHPSASIESASLTIGNGQDLPASDLQAQHAILVRAAAEGVGMYFATGDSLGVALPASDPDATAVGGTTLGIGAENQVLFQTGWSDNTEALVDGAWQEYGIFSAAGGGASSHYDQPAYQKGVVPDSLSDVDGRMARTVPDISADADGDTGMLFGQIEPTSSGAPGPYTPVAEGGTSMATPLVAGMVADAQQGQPRSFGFINPLLYSLAGSRAINDVLPLSSSAPQVDRSVFTTGTIDSEIGAPTDDEFGTQPGPGSGQVIAPGYDTVTGLGTPDGQAFIAALRGRCGGGWHPHTR